MDPSVPASNPHPPAAPSRSGDPPGLVRPLADLPGPRGVPILGNAPQLDAGQLHLTMEAWAQQFGPLYRIKLGPKPVLVVCDPAQIGPLLRDRPDAIIRSTRTTRVLTELGITGLFTAEGEDWRQQRKLVMRTLTPEVIRNFFPELRTMTQRLLRRWQAARAIGRPVDLLRDLKAYTLDVTIGLAMGQDLNTLERDDDPLQHAIEDIFQRVARRLTSPIPYWRYVRLPADRAAEASAARIRAAVEQFVAQTRARLQAEPERRIRPAHMLEALLVARDEAGSEFTDEHVIGNAVTMVLAGEDTTSHTIAWLLNFLAREPSAAARIAAEADAALDLGEVLQEPAVLDGFAYLEAATHEAMRMKPVFPFLTLEANCDVTVGGTLVPRGTLILTVLRHAGQQEEDFEQAALFRPERWLSDERKGTASDPGRRLFPFGAGPRFCPGRYLAMTEIKMAVSMIARNFTLTLEESAPPVKELFTFTMTPSALPVRLVPR
ncbi:cytochrome P450 [Aquabacterium sp. A7-Y]|uniref:cytochrome P450 n=1 Tax=Aquabacterium sp. A7-Y TaxID=1349605 RepID=UPI00223E7A7D|nr:cytochrome P450 [Aquabacterium sp. A7-Y]MCW7539501.1 cytochrome P450 [Aquabacterium sp. A7-Y]